MGDESAVETKTSLASEGRARLRIGGVVRRGGDVRHRARRLAASATLLLAIFRPAPAAVVRVCPSGCPQATIQGAVTTAMPGDTVRVLTTVPFTESDIVVDRDVIIEGLGRELTVVQAAASEGVAAAGVFYITPGVDVTIRDMKIRYGQAGSGKGGGIFNDGANLTLERVDVLSNRAYAAGGGLYNAAGGSLLVSAVTISHSQSSTGSGIYNESGGWLLVEDSQITFNSEAERGGGLANFGDARIVRCEIGANSLDLYGGYHYQGGGVFNDGTLEIVASAIRGNLVLEEDGQSGGGGIYSSGVLTLSQGLVEGNTSRVGSSYGGGILVDSGGEADVLRTIIRYNDGDNGGGIAVRFGALSVRESTIDHNGGGVFVVGPAAVSIEGTTISANIATGGAGIACLGCDLDLVNSTISGNEARLDGGGIYATSDATIRLANSTITGNSCDVDAANGGDGGGVYAAPGVVVILRNTVLAANYDLTGNNLYRASDCSGALSSDGYNLLGTRGRNLLTGIPPCSLSGGTGDLIGEDPLLGPLEDNGGPTLTHSIPPTSPAADSANPAGCADFDGVPIDSDQRGVRRLGRCDRGAFEIERPLFADGFESGTTAAWAAAVS